jgi:hypothetical protein
MTTELDASKQIYLATRIPQMSREQFRSRWRGHFELASSLPRWVNIRRYAQCDTIVDLPSASPISREYDGVGLHWYKSAEARGRHIGDLPSQRVMEADEDEIFSERVYNFAVPVGESVLVEGPASPIKLFIFLERKSSVGLQDFLRYYETDHARDLMAGSRPFDRLVMNRDLATEPRKTGLRFEAIDEISFGLVATAVEYCDSLFKRLDGNAALSDHVAEKLAVLTAEVKLHGTF